MRRDAVVWVLAALTGAACAGQSNGAVFCVGAGLAASGQQGAITLHDAATGSLLMTKPVGGTPIDAAASSSGAAWLVKGSLGPVVELRLPNGATSSLPAPFDTERIAWIGRHLALLSSQGGDLVEPASGAKVDPARVLPGEAAALFASSHVESDSASLLAFVRPYGLSDVAGGKRTTSIVSLYEVSGSAWRSLGRAITVAPRYKTISEAKFDSQGRYVSSRFSVSSVRLTLDELGIIALEEDGLLRVPMRQSVWQPERSPLLGPAPSWSEPIAASKGRLFRISQGRLYSHQLTSGGLEGWLPSVKSFVPLGITSAEGKVWILEKNGPLTVGASSGTTGGFVRFDLAPQALTPQQSLLVSELESWIGAPYKLGGNDRKGVDCSGLVVQAYLKLGMKLPRTSATLRTTGMGQVVTDGLKPGDVICVPGHVAIYVGGDQVIEASGKAVKRNPIWRFRDVLVRRFLN